MRISNGSLRFGASGASTLLIESGSLLQQGPIVELSRGSSSTVEQGGGEFRAAVSTAFHFSSLTNRRTEYWLRGGLLRVDYTNPASASPANYELMGQGGNDLLVVDGGRLEIATNHNRRIDIQRNSHIELRSGTVYLDRFARLSIGRDRVGEARLSVSGGTFSMTNTQAAAGGIVLGDYTHGRMTVTGGTVEISPSAQPPANRSGLVVGRKGKADTGRSRGSLDLSGGTISLPGLFMHLGDIGGVTDFSHGGRGTVVMTGGTIRARGIRAWDGGEYVADEPGDSFFFFHEGTIELEGDQRDWPEQAFVVGRSPVQRTYDPATNVTTLVATPDFSRVANFGHYRFRITKRRGGGPTQTVQLAELVLLRHGQPVETQGVVVTNPGGSNPVGEEPHRVMDGNPATKWLDFQNQPLVISFPVPVEVDAYQLVTANDAVDRDPLRWTLEGSHDGLTWEMVDRQARSYPIPKARFSGAVPMALPEDAPEEFAPAVFDARFVRFVPLGTRNPAGGTAHVSRLEFYRDETRVFPVSIGGVGGSAAAREFANDGRVRTFWDGAVGSSSLVFDFGSVVGLDSFLLANGGSNPALGPALWLLEGSVDGAEWFPLETRTELAFTSLREAYAVSAILPFGGDLDPDAPSPAEQAYLNWSGSIAWTGDSGPFDDADGDEVINLLEFVLAGISNIRNPILISYVAKGLLPYRGLGSGITRALKDWPEITFLDDREGGLFTATVRRPLPTTGGDDGTIEKSSQKGSQKSSQKILALIRENSETSS